MLRETAEGTATGTNLANLIRDERHRLGLTQQALANRAGVSQPEVARWESGRVVDISFHTRERLAEAGLDRIALGIAGFSLEEIEADIEASTDELLRLGKPVLGLRVLAPSLAWLNKIWNDFVTGDRRLGQREIFLVAQARYLAALGASLVAPVEGREWIQQQLAHSESAWHRLTDDRLRLIGLAEVTLISGNEFRKANELDDAIVQLNYACRSARKGGSRRIEAEAAGLLAYASSHQGHIRDARAAIEKAEDALENIHGSGDMDSVDIFDRGSLMEIRLRCESISGSKSEALRLARAPMPSFGSNYHWEIYYAITTGVVLASSRDSDCLRFFQHGYEMSVARQLPSNLVRIAEALKDVPGSEARELENVIYRELNLSRRDIWTSS